jgi:hypothetical protein
MRRARRSNARHVSRGTSNLRGSLRVFPPRPLRLNRPNALVIRQDDPAKLSNNCRIQSYQSPADRVRASTQFAVGLHIALYF